MKHITWPALFKLQYDDELMFCKNEVQWELLKQHAFLLSPLDYLVDVLGDVYHINETSEIKRFVYQKSITLDAIITLLKLHHLVDGACCLSKLSYKTTESAVLSLDLNDM